MRPFARPTLPESADMAEPVLDESAAALSDPPFAILLTGGRGSRLFELADSTCKPALPFVR